MREAASGRQSPFVKPSGGGLACRSGCGRQVPRTCGYGVRSARSGPGEGRRWPVSVGPGAPMPVRPMRACPGCAASGFMGPRNVRRPARASGRCARCDRRPCARRPPVVVDRSSPADSATPLNEFRRTLRRTRPARPAHPEVPHVRHPPQCIGRCHAVAVRPVRRTAGVGAGSRARPRRSAGPRRQHRVARPDGARVCPPVGIR